MSTSRDIQYIGGHYDACGGYHEYIRDVQYIRGIPWVHWGVLWVHRGDIMSTSGDVQYIRVDIMSTSGDVQYIGVFNRNWKDFINLLPHMHHAIPRCTEHPTMYSWYPPDVLMVSPKCTEHLPMYSWYPPHSSWCPLPPPPMYSWYPPMYSRYPPIYWTSPDVLNTHHTRCPHDMKRVTISLFILPHPRKNMDLHYWVKK